MYPSEFSTMVEMLRHRATTNPDGWAYSFLVDGEDEEMRWNYQQVDRRARAIAAAVQARVKPGDRILVLYPQGLEYIAALFGTLYANTLGIPLQPPDPRRLERTLPKLEAIVNDGGVKLVLADRALCHRADEVVPALQSGRRLHALVAAARRLCSSREHGD